MSLSSDSRVPIRLVSGIFVVISSLALVVSSPIHAREQIHLKPVKDRATETNVLNMYKNARQLMKAGKNVDARILLTKAATHDPTAISAYIHDSLSRIYHELGNPARAVDEALKALKFNPSMKSVHYNLAMYCQEANRYDEAIAALTKYAAGVKGDEKKKASDLIALLRKQRVKSKKFSPSTRDYLDQLTSLDCVSRWPRERIPLKVFIEPASTVPGFQHTFPSMARQAFVTWYGASGRKLAFEFVNSPKVASIQLTWTDKKLHDGAQASEREKYGSTTSSTTPGGEMKWARIQIRTVAPVTRNPVSAEKIKETCLHEIGHALGLNGHSTNPADIMYEGTTKRQLPALTKRDESTIARLYKAFAVSEMKAAAQVRSEASAMAVSPVAPRMPTQAPPDDSGTALGWMPKKPAPARAQQPPGARNAGVLPSNPAVSALPKPMAQPAMQPVMRPPVQQYPMQAMPQLPVTPMMQPMQQARPGWVSPQTAAANPYNMYPQAYRQPAMMPVQQQMMRPYAAPVPSQMYARPQVMPQMYQQPVPYQQPQQSPYGYVPQAMVPQQQSSPVGGLVNQFFNRSQAQPQGGGSNPMGVINQLMNMLQPKNAPLTPPPNPAGYQ